MMKQGSTYRMRHLVGATFLVCLAGCDFVLPSSPGLWGSNRGSAVSPTVSGVVTDVSNSSPIQGAQILIEDGPSAGSSTTTDADGKYWIEVRGGTMTIRASHSGYRPQAKSVATDVSRKLDFGLDPHTDVPTQTAGYSHEVAE